MIIFKFYFEETHLRIKCLSTAFFFEYAHYFVLNEKYAWLEEIQIFIFKHCVELKRHLNNHWVENIKKQTLVNYIKRRYNKLYLANLNTDGKKLCKSQNCYLLKLAEYIWIR